MTTAATGADPLHAGNTCYAELKHFAEFYEKMKKMDAELPIISDLMTRLAKLETDSTISVETTGVSRVRCGRTTWKNAVRGNSNLL